ncbi:hypothetical protein T265_03147 [Opisthorchis viverrini]|uniref:Uncharacterized protein n=1 Tax=Opisthorchis viverrini TaxID=6198 RepID=A0A074ZWW2_OPIVI|nr:hypothetical protein T265_03147 [Opisthorchis viverrini]KER30412.1 hypothetical protein T265_03147 [Opisthorchis viverrini]
MVEDASCWGCKEYNRRVKWNTGFTDRIVVVANCLCQYECGPCDKPSFQQLHYRKRLDLLFMMAWQQAALCFTWYDIRGIAICFTDSDLRQTYFPFEPELHKPWQIHAFAYQSGINWNTTSTKNRGLQTFSKTVYPPHDILLCQREALSKGLDDFQRLFHYWLSFLIFFKISLHNPSPQGSRSKRFDHGGHAFKQNSAAVSGWSRFVSTDYPVLHRLTPKQELQSSHIEAGIDVYFMSDPHNGLAIFACLPRCTNDRSHSFLDQRHVILPFPTGMGDLTTSMFKIGSCYTVSVPNCHDTRRQHKGWEPGSLIMLRLEKSKCRDGVRTTDLLHRLDLLMERNINEKFPDALALRMTCEIPASIRATVAWSLSFNPWTKLPITT